MSYQRESTGPAPLEALFRADTVRLEIEEDEDDHTTFVMNLSRLASSLAAVSIPSNASEPSTRRV